MNLLIKTVVLLWEVKVKRSLAWVPAQILIFKLSKFG